MTAGDNQRQKGVIILSLGSSGINWLKPISDATCQMGVFGEWLGFNTLERPIQTLNAQSYYRQVLKHASTPNGRFSINVFPHHLRHAHTYFGFDFIRLCKRECDVKLYLVTREDRLGQAISALLSQQGRAALNSGDLVPSGQHQKIHYSFESLCRLYFEIGQETDFWRSYLKINQYDFEAISYESLVHNPAPFLEGIAAHLGVEPPVRPESPLSTQMDDLTEEWRRRFAVDIITQGIHPDTYNSQ